MVEASQKGGFPACGCPWKIGAPWTHFPVYESRYGPSSLAKYFKRGENGKGEDNMKKGYALLNDPFLNKG